MNFINNTPVRYVLERIAGFGKNPWDAKRKNDETMNNYFDMKTRYVGEYVDGVLAKITIGSQRSQVVGTED